MLNILILEDDPLFAIDIEMCVDELGYTKLGVFDRAEDALTYLGKHQADMLICDIQLKGELTGLDVAAWAGKKNVPVVFVTSFLDDETFAKAKALAPCAYIIKPFKAGDLQRALELAALQVEPGNKEKDTENIYHPGKPFFLKHKNKLKKVAAEDIQYIVSDGNYATIVTKQGRFVVKRSLLNIAKSLPEEIFVRVHRSYLVKFEAIDNIYPDSQEIGIGEERIPLGRAYKAGLMERFQVL
ncbi:MAG: LytR/AlgR family response regulator transcription factor [Bacteroidia bacterium]